MEDIRKAMNERNLNEGQWEDTKQWSLGVGQRPSGTSEPGCPTTKTDTAERSISIGRESLQGFFYTRRRGVLAGFTARGQS